MLASVLIRFLAFRPILKNICERLLLEIAEQWQVWKNILNKNSQQQIIQKLFKKEKNAITLLIMSWFAATKYHTSDIHMEGEWGSVEICLRILLFFNNRSIAQICGWCHKIGHIFRRHHKCMAPYCKKYWKLQLYWCKSS